MTEKKKFIILGAGPVGLVTGMMLSEKGFKVEIYEMKNQVGGMCRSWKWSDFYVDTGPHIFHTSDKKLWKFWKKLFGNNLIPGIYRAKNVIGKSFEKLIDYPLSLEALNSLDKKLKEKIKNELVNLSKSKVPQSTNFKSHVINQVGPTLQNLFYEEYPEKVWGLETKQMTADWAPKRIIFTKKSIPFFNKEYTGVGKYGTGQLYDIIKKKILNNNGKIFLNHKVKKFKHQNNIIKEIIFDNKKNISPTKNDIIISSLPINLTSHLLGYKSELRFRGIRSVYIALNKKRAFKEKVNWLYFADKSIIFNRVSEPKTMSKYLGPKNKTYLCVEIAYSKNDMIDKLSFNEIKKIIKKDLIKTKLVKSLNEIYSVSENKEDIVYPIQFKNYKKNLV